MFLSRLTGLAKDWGVWDDTYRFVAGDYPDYVKVNLLPSTFDNAQIHMVSIIGLDGRICFHQVHDPARQRFYQLPEFAGGPETRRILEQLVRLEESGKLQGLLMTGHGPLLLAASSILPSDGSGPSRGFVVMGQFLDANLREELNRQVGLPLSIQVASRTAPPTEAFLLPALSPSEPAWGLERATGAWTFIPSADLYQQPKLQLCIVMDREVTLEGLRSMGVATLVVMLASLVFLGEVFSGGLTAGKGRGSVIRPWQPAPGISAAWCWPACWESWSVPDSSCWLIATSRAKRRALSAIRADGR